MQQAGMLTRDNMLALSAMTGKAQKEIEKIIREAGFRSLDLAESIYREAMERGLLIYQALPLTASPIIKQILDAAVKNAQGIFNLINTTALESARAGFLEILNQVYLETSLGISTYDEAMRKAVRLLSDKGITGVTYRAASGRITRTTVDVAARRAILTSSAQAAGNLQIARAHEYGVNLVEVSSHWDARPSHAAWQGAIYQIEGQSAQFPNLAEATDYGSVIGLCGANCRHVFYPFFEGISEQRYKPYDLAENNRRYELSQEQRAIERDIRKYKRREAAAGAAGDAKGAAAARAKIKEKQAKMLEFIDETGRTRRRNREQVPS